MADTPEERILDLGNEVLAELLTYVNDPGDTAFLDDVKDTLSQLLEEGEWGKVQTVLRETKRHIEHTLQGLDYMAFALFLADMKIDEVFNRETAWARAVHLAREPKEDIPPDLHSELVKLIKAIQDGYGVDVEVLNIDSSDLFSASSADDEEYRPGTYL